ncbi:MAG: GNAT family N-acetyltransferase [Muribaculaceae bacterium]|nr:GNAT family N-acetyltransferase [Muribaculaceae bacterium]
MKKKEFEDIFARSFGDSAEWQRWFFSNVVEDDLVMLGDEINGKSASALLMQPYDFLYAGSVVPSMYISCVATRPEARARGAATALMAQALNVAREKGAALCELIPADDHLYFFYDRLGFATVFYEDRMHFTAAHPFDGGRGEEIKPDAELLAGLEQKFGCGILHSATDYKNILGDMAVDGNANVIAVADGDDKALLFATATRSNVNVKLLLADTQAVAAQALHLLRQREPDKTFVVSTPPLSGEKAFMRPRGMGRIVNPQTVLQSLAAAHTDLEYTISVHDEIIPENNGVYLIGGGNCMRQAALENDKLDLDVDITTLTALLFSSHAAGNIFSLPARRPFMALMLD